MTTPEPVSPAPDTEALRDGQLWSVLDWSLWGNGLGDVLRSEMADVMIAALTPEQREQAEACIKSWHERRSPSMAVGVGTQLERERDEARAEVDRLKSYLLGRRNNLAQLLGQPASEEDTGWYGLCAQVQEREAGLRTDLDQARRERDEAQRQEAAWRASAQESDKGLTLYAREVRRLRAELAGARTIPDDAAERLARLLYAATRTDARLPAEIPDNWVGEHGHVLVERGYDKTWIDYARKVLTDLGLSTTRTPPAPAATVVQWLPATYVNTAGGGGCANCNGYQPLGHEGKCYPYGQGPTPDRLPPNTRFVFSPSATAEPTATGNLHDADVTEDPNEPGRYIATCPACHVSITGAESVVEDAADQHFSEAALGVGYQALTTEPDDEWENRHDPAEDIGCTNPPAVSCSDAGCPRHGHDTEEGDTDE